jgi:nitroreductase
MLADLVRRCRTCRRYHAGRPVAHATLRELVDTARLTASAANRQPLRYVLSSSSERNALIFPHLRWAGYLADWDGPQPTERPAAYIIILGDGEVAQQVRWDDAIAAYTIMLGAAEHGLGSCIFASIARDELRAALAIPDRYAILLAVSLGEPLEKVVLDDMPPDGDIRYWRDAAQVHHVPKRRLDDVIVDFG